MSSTSTWDISGTDNKTSRSWIEFQVSPNMIWSNIEMTQLKPFSSFDVTNDKELKEAFNWLNSQLIGKFVRIRELKLKTPLLDYILKKLFLSQVK